MSTYLQAYITPKDHRANLFFIAENVKFSGILVFMVAVPFKLHSLLREAQILELAAVHEGKGSKVSGKRHFLVKELSCSLEDKRCLI